MYLKPGDRVLDVGCADGTLFRQVHGLGDRSVWTRTSNSIIYQRYPTFVLSEGYFHKLCSLTSGPG